MRQQLLQKYTVLVARTGRTPITLSFTPISGLVILLVLLGVPLGWLGTVMFSLLQNNVELSQENRQLSEKAHKVISELDTIDSEIEILRERAGLSETDFTGSQPDAELSRRLPPRGGALEAGDALSLYSLAEQRMPQLSSLLDGRVKPALEETLAAEEAEAAAYPDGKPLNIPLEVSSSFGLRPNPFGGRSYEIHSGIDFKGPYGTPIVAAAKGRVKQAGYNGGYGNSVTLDHGYGYETLYAHMSDVTVAVGDTLKRGDVVGHLGSTGRSSGPHLHYGIYRQGEAVDPIAYLDLEYVMTLSDYWRLR
ncbi:MAG: M23 family metallopeptidase [Leptolyngbya sp. SIO4C1]|nr:M23 family metallopeptidase [Leptolyngbya sp. SIO4C1]